MSNTELELSKSATSLEQLRSEKSILESQLNDAKRSNTDYVEKIREYERREGELSAGVDEGKRAKEDLAVKSQEVVSVSERLTKREEEIADLRNQCEILRNSHEKETSLLRDEIAHLLAELTTSQDEMKNLQKSKSKLEADQSANRWSIEELTEKLNAELAKTSKLENLIREKDSKFQDVENALSELHKTNDTLLIDKETSEKNLTASLNAMTSTVEELRGKLRTAEETISDRTDKISKVRAETEELRTQITELSSIISSIRDEYICINNEMKNAQEAAEQRQGTINELTEAKTALENSIKSLETQLSNTCEELDKTEKLLVETKVRTKESDASRMEEILRLRDSLEFEVAAWRKKIEDANRRNEELEEKLRRSQDVVDKQTADLSDKEAAVGKLKAQVRTLVERQVERAKAEQQSRNEEIRLKQSELSGANKRIHELQHTVNTLEKKLKEQETKSADLAKAMESNEQEVDKNVQNLLEKLNVAKVEETRLLDELSRL